VCNRCGEVAARSFDVAPEAHDVANDLAAAPETELVAVGIDQVRQRLQPCPLLFVVPVAKAPRVGALARCLDLDEAGQRIGDHDSVVGAGLQVAERRFGDCHYSLALEPAQLCHVREQPFQGTAKLIFRLPGDGDVVQFRFGVGAEPGDSGREGDGHCGEFERRGEVLPEYQKRQNWYLSLATRR